MASLTTIPGINIILFAMICLTQIAGGAILPKTNGFTDPAWVAACLAVYTLSFWLMAAMIKLGMPLSSLVPLMSAIIPLCLIAVGVFVFGEQASLPKIGLLMAACGLIGVAARIG